MEALQQWDSGDGDRKRPVVSPELRAGAGDEARIQGVPAPGEIEGPAGVRRSLSRSREFEMIDPPAAGDAGALGDRLQPVDPGASTPDWDQFVVSHSATIRRTIARILRDPEEVENAYVAVLARLRDGAFDQLPSVESVPAWLTVVSTRVAIDHARRLFGRLRWPEALQRLDPIDRRVFELCHRQGLDFRQSLESLRAEGTPLTLEELAAAVHRVEIALTPQARRQLARQFRAREIGVPPRFVDTIDHAAEEMARRAERMSPEWQVLQREAAALRGRLQRLLETLDARDRELLHRYYYDEQAAAEIDIAMQFGGVRRVHTALERLRRSLRRGLSYSEDHKRVRHPSEESGEDRGER